MSEYRSLLFEYFDGFLAEKNWGIPILQATSYIPKEIIGFNYARSIKKRDCAVHFFLDDYQFERVWNRPEDNIAVLKNFSAVFTPDFSLYTDMPKAMMLWNVYRSRMLGQIWQKRGMIVIPTIQWADHSSYEFVFDGLPRGGVVAVSSVGVCNSDKGRRLFCDGYAEMIYRLVPNTVLFYGKNILPKDSSLNCECNVIEFRSFTDENFNKEV